MTARKWQKVKEIFDKALRESPETYKQFVAEACDDDSSLFFEVNSLPSSLGKVKALSC